MIGRRGLRPAAALRGLSAIAVVLIGLATIVGSGGGEGIGMPSDCPPGWSCGPPPVLSTVEVRPAHLTVQVGDPASFEAVLSNISVYPGYRWSRSSDGGSTFSTIAGATGPVYTLAGATLADDGVLFEVGVNTATSRIFAVAHLAVSARPPVVFEDGEFAPGDWEVVDDGTTQLDEQVATGGNPGAFRRMTQQVSLQAGSSSVIHFFRAAVYDPVTQGAVYVIDYAEDGLMLEGDSVVSYPALEQSGRRYRGAYRVTGATSLTSQWRHEERYASLTEGDFRQIDGPPCGADEACPDFAAGAASLRFGFLRVGQAHADGRVVHGIDNWKVAVWPR